MSDWNSGLYLQFARERTQPPLDLAARLARLDPASVLDAGCGPGNSTVVLAETFPGARITGLDQSVSMIERAKKDHPGLRFETGDLLDLTGQYDLIFSNAVLQWIPDHETLLPFLMDHLNPGGTLAVSIPVSRDLPLYRIIRETAEDSGFDFTKAKKTHNEILTPDKYHDILSPISQNVQIWQTTYYHPMASHKQLLAWAESTRLRPYLDCLRPAQKARFRTQILKRLEEAYPPRKDGTILFPFSRLFFTARKPGNSSR